MSNSTIPPLNLDIGQTELIQKLKVKKKAASAVQTDSAVTDRSIHDDNELRFIEHFREQLGKLNDWTRALLKQQEEIRGTVDLEQDARQLSRLKNSMVGAIGKTLITYNGKLIDARRRERRQQKNFNAFRVMNDLMDREPHYPKSPLYHYSVVAVIALLEIILNTIIFAKGNAMGPLGGFWEATLVAVVNLSVAYVAGRFAMRQANHVETKRKVGGWMGIAGYLCALPFINLMAAHYRAILDAASTIDTFQNALSLAFKNFWAAPFQIEDFQAWMLLFIGLVASIVMLNKSYTDDDPYPGYGKVHRALEEARANYEGLKQEMVTAMADIRERHLDDIEKLIRKSRADLTKFEASIETTRQINETYRLHFSQIQSSAQTVMAAYREFLRNIGEFSERQVPNIGFAFSDDTAITLPEIEPLRTSLKTYEDALEGMNSQASEVAEEIQDRGNTALDDAHELFKTIERRAEDALDEEELEIPEDMKTRWKGARDGENDPSDTE